MTAQEGDETSPLPPLPLKHTWKLSDAVPFFVIGVKAGGTSFSPLIHIHNPGTTRGQQMCHWFLWNAEGPRFYRISSCMGCGMEDVASRTAS